MIFYYKIKLQFWINDFYVIKDYLVSYLDIIDFLYNHKKKNSTCTIVSIKPHYYGR